MEKFKRSAACVFMLAAVSFASCTFFEIVRHNFSGIEDYKIFPKRELKASASPFRFRESLDAAPVPMRVSYGNEREVLLENMLQASGTVAFLMIKNDTVLYERYYEGHADSSLSLSFSMAKSFLSMLIGCAIDDGYIASVEQAVTDYVPELQRNGFASVKIKHLLQMTSGMDYVESDNPFALHPRFYYGNDLEKRLLHLKTKEKPGRRFVYKSGDNQLLGLILARALKTKNITAYMQEKIWEPLGMEQRGLWSIDHEGEGLEKTFCCVSACARDFAKLGRLYLNLGNWNGKQIVSRAWVERSTASDTSEGSAWNYQYQWWIVSHERGDYMAAGHLGQFLYVHPRRGCIIVRLGKSKGSLTTKEWQEVFANLSERI